jgi:hypothetical protein
MLFIAGLAVGGFFLAQAVLPSILALLAVAIAVVGKTIVLVGLCSALAALLFIITNKNFLTLLRYGFKSVMRKITSMFVEIDPIGIMKNYIEDLLEKYEVMKKNVNELKGRLNQLQTLITTNEKERQNQLMMAKRAHDNAEKSSDQNERMQMQSAFTLSSRQAGRLGDVNEKYTEILNRMTMLYNALMKYSDVTNTTILDLKSEVSTKEQERAQTLAAFRAMSAASAILNGSGAAKELFDQAMEFTVEETSRKIGEIDNFMEMTQSFINNQQLMNGVYDDKAMAEFDKWSKNADSIMLGGDKRQILETPPIMPSTISSVASSGQSYDKFFTQK